VPAVASIHSPPVAPMSSRGCMWPPVPSCPGASVAAHYDAVASIDRQALAESLVDVNPCARIRRPKVLRELQHREVPTVLESLPSSPRPARSETTPASYDISPDALEQPACHQVAGFLAGWAS
jgi:hypothetical protein